MVEDALTCFTSLLESVPGWIADLENILKVANSRQREFQLAYQSSTAEGGPKCRKSRSSSMKSHRSRDRHSAKDVSTGRAEWRNFPVDDAVRIAQRIRNSPSELSGQQSGPSKYRVKSSGAIYYDGTVQKSFEQLVRGVGAARNTVRKGKMSVKVDALSRTGSSSSDGSSESDDFSPMTANLHFKSTRSRPRPFSTFAREDGSAAFDRVDGQLEKAQTLCERAAHQLLRDGDCSPEVTTAHIHLTEALRLAELEIPALRRRAEKAAQRQRRSEERRRADEEAEESLGTSDATSLESDSKDIHIVPVFPSEGNLEVDDLEIDPDDDGDDQMPAFTIGTLPSGKFTHYRSIRLPTRAC